MKIWIFLTIVVNLSFAQAERSSQFWQINRQMLLSETLTAFANSDHQRIQNSFGFLKNGSRYSCASDVSQLRIQCLMELARQQCRSYGKSEFDACLLYSDVIVTNIVEMDVFIPRQDLMRIYRNSVGIKDPTKEALRRRYAMQTVQFINDTKKCEARNYKCMADRIDNFCLVQTTRKKQSYQACAASLVWFYAMNSAQNIAAKNGAK